MKVLPTVVASSERAVGIALVDFQGAHPIANRDARGFYYRVQRAPQDPIGRLAVLFSGTVFYIKTETFGLPAIPDIVERFQVFAEAAIGDSLLEYGLPEHTPSGLAAHQIECFSPHFESWEVRPPASDDEIETYIRTHVFWAWRFAHEGWELGLSDYLRLHQPRRVVERLVTLGQDRDWTVEPRPFGSYLKPTPDFLRQNREPPPPAPARNAAEAEDARDHLTQLLGRAPFDTVLREQCGRATGDQPVSLILADIDHFKTINDTHGHPFGDAVLRDAADRFAGVVQSKGLVFRYGGEEFAAVLPNHTIEEAVAVAERTRLAMESARIKDVAVTCSFGVATAPIHASDPEQLLERADRALYDSKRLGRNLVRIFGEPTPEQPRAKPASRKLAQSGELSDEVKEEMRMQIVRGGTVSCPEDDVPLDVIDATTMGDMGRSFLVHCPGCGFQAALPAPKRAV